MLYLIQKRIHTLAQNAVMDEESQASFTRANIRFTHWDFNYTDAWHSPFWLAEGKTEAANYKKAWEVFSENLSRVVPIISVIGQSYIEFNTQPFLIKKAKSDVAYFGFRKDRGAVGLMFQKNELKALDFLLNNTDIPKEFYYYWNDAVNTIGYSSKLVLMFAALEALFKRDRKRGKKPYYAKMKTVFGPDLMKELYGTEQNSESGLRQRLIHGEYLDISDTHINYVERIHKQLIRYLNTQVFRDNLISEEVVNPQRHFSGNIEGWEGYIRSKGGPLELMDLFHAFREDFDNAKGYEMVSPEDFDDLNSTY